MCSCRELTLCVAVQQRWSCFWHADLLIWPLFNKSGLTPVHLLNEPHSAVISLGYLLSGPLARLPLFSISVSHAVFTLQPVGGADLDTLPAQQETESRAREMGRAQRSWWMISFYPIVSAFPRQVHFTLLAGKQKQCRGLSVCFFKH